MSSVAGSDNHVPESMGGQRCPMYANMYQEVPIMTLDIEIFLSGQGLISIFRHHLKTTREFGLNRAECAQILWPRTQMFRAQE